MFLGAFCGITLYMITLSKIFIKINVYILNFIKKIISIFIKIFKIPIELITNIIKKAVLNPIILVCKNLKRILTETFKKRFNMTKYYNKAKK